MAADGMAELTGETARSSGASCALNCSVWEQSARSTVQKRIYLCIVVSYFVDGSREFLKVNSEDLPQPLIAHADRKFGLHYILPWRYT